MSPEDREALRQLLIADEGMRLRLYLDTRGKASIGVGRNVLDDGISEAEALYLLDNDITATLNGLTQALPWTTQQDAPRLRVLANIGFNTGIDGLLKFHKMLAALQRGDRESAAREVVASQLAPARAQRLAALLRS